MGNEDEVKVRGLYVGGVVSFVQHHYEPAVREKILQAVSADVRAASESIDKNAWYPLRFIIDYFRAIESVRGDLQKVSDDLEACGIFISTEATSTFMKLLIKVLTPKMFARQFPEFWKKYHSRGTVSSDVARVDDKIIDFTIEGIYDYLAFTSIGFVKYAFQALGKKGVTVTHDLPPGERNAPQIHIHVSWQ